MYIYIHVHLPRHIYIFLDTWFVSCFFLSFCWGKESVQLGGERRGEKWAGGLVLFSHGLKSANIVIWPFWKKFLNIYSFLLDFRAKKVHLSVPVNPQVCFLFQKGKELLNVFDLWNSMKFPGFGTLCHFVYICFSFLRGTSRPKYRRIVFFWVFGTCYGLVVLEGIMLAYTHVDFLSIVLSTAKPCNWDSTTSRFYMSINFLFFLGFRFPYIWLILKWFDYLGNTDTAALYIDFNQEIPKNQGELQQHHPCEAMNSVVPIGFISLSVVKNWLLASRPWKVGVKVGGEMIVKCEM